MPVRLGLRLVTGMLGALCAVSNHSIVSNCITRLLHISVLEEQVVIALRIKRRIEIDQVQRLIRSVLPQHLQIIAGVELVHAAMPKV